MATVTPMRTASEQALQNRFAEVSTTLPGMPELRATAMALFREKGLPHKRIEAWHYSDLRNTLREVAPAAAMPDEKAIRRATQMIRTLHRSGGRTIALVDGYLCEELSDLRSLPSGLTITSLASALVSGDKRCEKLGKPVDVSDNAAVWLNTAFLSDGLIIEIDSGLKVPEPIEILHIATHESASAIHTRILVLAGAGSTCTIVERQLSSVAGHQLNTMIEFGIGKEANIEHVRIDQSAREAIVLSTLTAAVHESARFNSFNLQIGGGFVRHQPFVRYAGTQVFVGIRGVNLLEGRQHADTTLTVDHAVPFGTSRELFRSVVDDEATGTFQGKIIVRQDAQKTDGQMASNALLLSDEATMNNKPELEIFADDVVCAHGATCGALNEDQLFYLMQRGLPKLEAEALLIEAFAGEAIDAVADEAVQTVLRNVVAQWLINRAAPDGAML